MLADDKGQQRINAIRSQQWLIFVEYGVVVFLDDTRVYVDFGLSHGDPAL